MTKLMLRLIGPDDYAVHEDGHLIGRIRFASDRAPALWVWAITVTLPGPPFGDAQTLDEAKARFKAAWQAFKSKHSAGELAKAFEAMAHANRPGTVRAVISARFGSRPSVPQPAGPVITLRRCSSSTSTAISTASSRAAGWSARRGAILR